MSKYKGLFTFDVENHRYVTVGAADGIIDCMDYKPSEPAEPLIKDEKIRKAVRAWAEACELDTAQYDDYWRSFRCDDCVIGFKTEYTNLNLDDGKWYTIAELCGEEE